MPAVPAAVVDDPAAAYAAMRKDLLPYFGLPFYRAMIERSGFGDGHRALRRRRRERRHRGDAGAAISDEFLAGLTAVGDEDAVRAGVERYARRRRHLALRRPDRQDRLRGDAARRGAVSCSRAAVGAESVILID